MRASAPAGRPSRSACTRWVCRIVGPAAEEPRGHASGRGRSACATARWDAGGAQALDELGGAGLALVQHDHRHVEAAVAKERQERTAGEPPSPRCRRPSGRAGRASGGLHDLEDAGGPGARTSGPPRRAAEDRRPSSRRSSACGRRSRSRPRAIPATSLRSKRSSSSSSTTKLGFDASTGRQLAQRLEHDLVERALGGVVHEHVGLRERSPASRVRGTGGSTWMASLASWSDSRGGRAPPASRTALGSRARRRCRCSRTISTALTIASSPLAGRRASECERAQRRLRRAVVLAR